MMVLLLAIWGPSFVLSGTQRYLSLAHVTFVRLKWLCFVVLGIVLFPALLMMALRGPIERKTKQWSNEERAARRRARMRSQGPTPLQSEGERDHPHSD